MGTPTEWPSNESRESSQSIWLWSTTPKLRDTECATSCNGSSLPNSLLIDVTGFDVIPHGIIKLK